jgi:hypothetical protein
MKSALLVIAVAALLVPVAALADNTTPAPTTVASQLCSQARTQMGTNFALTYGTNASKSNAFGQCVSKQTKPSATTVQNALSSCKAEQAADPAAFDKKYGTNGKTGSKGAAQNAMGKCVSVAVKAANAAKAKSLATAAAACKTALKASKADFAAKWGSKPGAFGRCVAATAKTK